MMKKKGSEFSRNNHRLSPFDSAEYFCTTVHHYVSSVSRTGGYEAQSDAPVMGPTPIINIKKEKRETEEETKEILRSLERDNVSPTVPPRQVALFCICT